MIKSVIYYFLILLFISIYLIVSYFSELNNIISIGDSSIFNELYSINKNVEKGKNSGEIQGNLFIEPMAQKEMKEEFERFSKYSRNYEYVINNNIAQYSSYVVIDEDENNNKFYKIEALIKFNYITLIQSIKEFGSKENFTCLVKLLSEKNMEEVIEIEAVEMPKFGTDFAAKLIFILNSNLFLNSSKFDLKNILIGIIWKPDFSKSLIYDSNTFINDLNKNKSIITLPYFLIKFQIPTIIDSINPRLPSVGLCVHFTYNMPSYTLNWIDYQLSFGIGQIIMYDATDDLILTKSVYNFYGKNDRVTIRPYYMTFEKLCSESVLFQQYDNIQCPVEIKKFMTNSCRRFFQNEFSVKYQMKSFHESLTVNDCFTILREKFEFIAHFDLDELIFPRVFNNLDDFYTKNATFTCHQVKSICQQKTFSNDFKSDVKDYNYFYNYLQSVISKYKWGKDLSKLSSIYFQHAAYIIPNQEERKLMAELDLIIKKLDTNKEEIIFPIKIYLSAPPYKIGHTFVIDKQDIRYIRYLHEVYSNLVSCTYDKYLNNSNRIDRNLVRYLYYISERVERSPKVVHYYKNVKTIFIHHGVEFVTGDWKLYISPNDIVNGHFLAHYRTDLYWLYNANSNGPISKLNFDHEYLFFMLQNFTNFCDKTN